MERRRHLKNDKTRDFAKRMSRMLEIYPEHNTDSDECWCDPQVEYQEDGSKVIIHNTGH